MIASEAFSGDGRLYTNTTEHIETSSHISAKPRLLT